MNHEEQADAFTDELERLIDRYREEFDLQYYAVIGILDMAKAQLLHEALFEGDEEQP